MSKYDYDVSKQLDALDAPFAALVMAAYRKADSANTVLLAQAFPEICAELQHRYHAPLGWLESDPDIPSNIAFYLGEHRG